jgi:hypothetical protein
MAALVDSRIDWPGHRVAGWLKFLSSHSLAQTALLLYAFALLILIAVNLLFTGGLTGGDDQGLYNPIYNIMTLGRMIYPLHGQPDTMTVHPPLHYFVVGMIGRLGFHVYHAAGLVPLLWTGGIYWLVFRAPWSTPYKLALFISVALVVGVYVPLLTIRPEVHLLTAWFCGLVLLELGRARNWDKRYLAAGSFCIAYTSGLHYWALPVNFALPAFLLLLWYEWGFRAAVERLPSMIIGWLLFYVPYTVLFWIPNWTTILGTLGDASGGSSVAMSIQEYLNIFTYDALVTPWRSMAPIGWAFYFPIAVGIPLFAFAIPILFLMPRFRGLALGGAPIAIFIYLFVPRKAGLFYTQPELLLYTVALTSLLFLGAMRFSSLLAKTGQIVVPIVALSTALVTAYASKPVAFPLVLVRNDWDVVRAMTRSVVGPDALVGINTVYPWYMSGGRYVYRFIKWGFSAKDVASDQVRRFDALMFQNDWLGNQRAAVPFPWLYLDGVLNLKAVVIMRTGSERLRQARGWNRKWPPSDSDYALVYVTPKPEPKPTVLVAQSTPGVLYSYRENAQGDYVFVTLLAATSALDHQRRVAARSIATGQILLEDNTKSDEVWLFLHLFDRKSWEEIKGELSQSSKIREAIAMSVTASPLSDLPLAPHNDAVEVVTDVRRLEELRP